MKISYWLSISTAIALLTGCGGSSSDTPTDATTTITGQFIDSAVEGLDYSCSSGTTGTTNANGDFTCNVGDTVTFSINGFEIGSATADTTITPKTLQPNDDVAMTNIAQLLQTLDSDGNTANGITINKQSQEVKALSASIGVTLKQADFDSAIASHIGKALVDGVTAKNHLDLNIQNTQDSESTKSSENITDKSVVVVQTGTTETICNAYNASTAEFDGYSDYTSFVSAGGSSGANYYDSTSKSCNDYSSAGFCNAQDVSSNIGGSGSCVVVTTFPESASVEDTTESKEKVTAPILKGSYNLGSYRYIKQIEGDKYLAWYSNYIKYTSLTDNTDIWTSESNQNLSVISSTSNTVTINYSGEYGTKQAPVDIINISDGSIKESILFDFGQYIYFYYVNTDSSVFVARFQDDDAYKIISKDGSILKSFENTQYRFLDANDNIILMYDYSKNVQAYQMDGTFIWEKNIDTISKYEIHNDYLYTWTASSTEPELTKIDLSTGEIVNTISLQSKYAGIDISFDSDVAYINQSGWDNGNAIYNIVAVDLNTMSESWNLANKNFMSINPAKNIFYTSNYGGGDIGSLTDGSILLEDGLSDGFSDAFNDILNMNSDGTFFIQQYDSKYKTYTYDLYE
jgi:hypothetical protein